MVRSISGFRQFFLLSMVKSRVQGFEFKGLKLLGAWAVRSWFSVWRFKSVFGFEQLFPFVVGTLFIIEVANVMLFLRVASGMRSNKRFRVSAFGHLWRG